MFQTKILPIFFPLERNSILHILENNNKTQVSEIVTILKKTTWSVKYEYSFQKAGSLNTEHWTICLVSLLKTRWVELYKKNKICIVE